MKKEKKSVPTDAELEILQILWQHKGATVREVYDLISQRKKCAYTSTLKIMQNMTAKGLVRRTITDQVHTYEAAVEEARVRNSQVKELIDRFFRGSYSQLALHALGQSSKEEDLDELLDLVKKLKKDKK
ncbi:BlaI/MecI/CopY family transcriptional regulator [Puia sp.]|jgi:predicted transcriptional regulator|uniref:BlaI/MecI/CopY family transcriptional regulator n=1 Tax=Puia sp. TaxID=2045100 RepID=UPI002F428EE4